MKDISFWIVSYDVKDNKRRIRVAKELKNYGHRVQYSVFECLLSVDKAEQLKEKLEKLVLKNEDSIRFYRLCEGCKKRIFIFGQGRVTDDEDVYII